MLRCISSLCERMAHLKLMGLHPVMPPSIASVC